MNKFRRTILGIFTVAVFVVFMMFNMTKTDTGVNLTLCGGIVMADDLPCEEEEPYLYYNNQNPWDARNCNISGNNCLTCTVPAP